MKTWATILVIAMAFVVTGCEKKTPSEQLRDDMKKAGKQLEKDLKSL